MPKYWITHPPENNFPLSPWQETQKKADGAQMRSIIPGMGHGHHAAWSCQEPYGFAVSITRRGKPWCRQISASKSDDNVYNVTFESFKAFEKAELWYATTGVEEITGVWKGDKEEATVVQDDESTLLWHAQATLPPDTISWWITLYSCGLVVSSEFNDNSG